MSRYVYPIFNVRNGSYFGTQTSEKNVISRLKKLEKSRKERFEVMFSRIDTYMIRHDGDRAARLLINTRSLEGESLTEEFVAYRSKI